MTWARKRRLARVCRPSCVDVVAGLLQDSWIADYSLSLDVGEGELELPQSGAGQNPPEWSTLLLSSPHFSTKLNNHQDMRVTCVHRE
jgi:hypothetical protein